MGNEEMHELLDGAKSSNVVKRERPNWIGNCIKGLRYTGTADCLRANTPSHISEIDHRYYLITGNNATQDE